MEPEIYLVHLLLSLNKFYDKETDLCYIEKTYFVEQFVNEMEKPYFDENFKKLIDQGFIEIQGNRGSLYVVKITEEGRKIIDRESTGGKSPFDSESERKLIQVLKDICQGCFEILLKIRVKDLIKNQDTILKEYQPFAEKSHFDIVIYEKDYAAPVLVVEYDGFHDPEQKKRDFIKDKICKVNNIPIIRLDNTDTIDERTIIRKLLALLQTMQRR